MPRPSKSKVLTRSDQPHHRQPFSPGVFNVANFVHGIIYLDIKFNTLERALFNIRKKPLKT